MGLLSTLRGLLPASSRSVHGMWQDIPQRIDASEIATYRYIDWKIDDLVLPRLNRIEGLVRGYTEESLNLQWQMYMQPGESLDEARRRFYSQMPPATGTLRLLQKANTKLLFEFDEFCRANDVKYFLCSGTLLGALRHGGCIPWDDDMDVGLEKSQLDKLMQCIAAQDRYRVTVVFDLNVFCKQIRFRWMEEDLPCFIDLFVYEYASDAGVAGEERCCELRSEVIEGMRAIKEAGERSRKFVVEGDDDYETCGRIVDGARRKAAETGLICAAEDAQAMMWGLENISTPRLEPPVCPIGWIEPYAEASYDGVNLPIPADAQSYLQATYGDWMGMPRDRSHDIVHAKGDAFAPECLDAMRRQIGE